MSFVDTKAVIPEALAYFIVGNGSSDSGLWVNLSLFLVKLFEWNSGNNLIAGT